MKTHFHRNPSRAQIKLHLDWLFSASPKGKAAKAGEREAALEKSISKANLNRLFESVKGGAA
jgi:hypothetical protein